jgi:diacylglycerol O-acyltransferase
MADIHKQDSLTSSDALFLYLERQGQPVNVASVSVFEGIISLDRCLEFIDSKLRLIPRYRQRVVTPVYNIDLPSWENDPEFDLRSHVREVALEQGTEAEFKAVAGQVLSTTLDRRRPLWDFTLVHGLNGNRTGAILRMHHCLADGIAGVGLLNTLLDSSPNPRPSPKPGHSPAPPTRPATESSLLNDLVSSYISGIKRILAAETDVLTMAKQMAGAVAGKEAGASEPPASAPAKGKGIPLVDEVQRLLPELATSARLPFNLVCRGPQQFNYAEIPFAEIKAIKDTCEATVNDVVLTVVTSAVRRYAEEHGVPLVGRLLRIVVPVNIRGEAKASEFGNRITFFPVDIPLDIADPRKLLEAVRAAVARARSTHLAELVGLLGTVLGAIPTVFQALIGPFFSQLPLSLCNLICTNVPGPTMPLYFAGHRLLSCYPYVPIGGEMGMNCAVLTYDGVAYFGFTGDTHAIPDLHRLDGLLRTSFTELRKAAGVRSRPRRKRARPKVRPAAAPAAVDGAASPQEAASPMEVEDPLKAAPDGKVTAVGTGG